MIKYIYRTIIVLIAILSINMVNIRASEINISFNYPATGLRDPFVPSSASTPKQVEEEENADNILAQKHLKVEGILWDPNDPYVIINDNILRVGDEIEGIMILKIEKESVTFGYKDKTLVVPLIGKGE